VLHIWALLLLSHPLLSSKIRSSSYQNVTFNYTRPSTFDQALNIADDLFNHFDKSQRIDLIDEYLNGNRTLSNERLGMLFLKNNDKDEWEIMLTATHFLGDGMALHTLMNQFYILLSSTKTIKDLEGDIEEALNLKVELPKSLEDRLPQSSSSIASIVGQEEYIRSENKNIGGQSFPVAKSKKERRTVVPTFAYNEAETKRILGKCKANGVTIAHAIFALCNIAWARKTTKREDPW